MLEINKYNKIVAANWKLNCSFEFIRTYFEIFNSEVVPDNVCSIFCPPPPFLQSLPFQSSKIHLGGQNCSIFEKGPYTGEISAAMLRENNCNFCLVGHSERRQIFKENNEDVRLKSENLIKNKIIPIICVGETFDENQKGITKSILYDQIIQSLPKNATNKTAIIAYEPIWAIGTGLTPTLDQISDVHEYLKNGLKLNENYKILYGGSVKSDNAREILNLKSVDGVLVGGASLDPEEFIKILKI